MLTIRGARYAFSDGVSRCDFLWIGGLGLARLALPDLLRLQARGAATASKSVIMLFQPGGPGHIDRYNMKADRCTCMPAIVTHNTEPIANLL